ncbi:MAG: protein phosphatase CheZ [Betaproteobacteria bacterium]|jgi:chemotaxis phosphatase, CheZ|nr:protein phosphatase CheZ [Betaproteobacteria bacterium]
MSTHDSDDLEALFDSIVSAQQSALSADTGADSDLDACPTCENSEKVFNKIGQLTRTLHDSLRELGLDKNLESVASSIPDACDRLGYVAAMTQQAAERVLNATDAASPLVEKIQHDAHQLSVDWQSLFDGTLNIDQFKQLVTRTHAYLAGVPKQAKAINTFLMDIVMAQDFQDLTGQVIKKTLDVTQNMERQLVSLLMESAPSQPHPNDDGLLNGPVVTQNGRNDIVTSQDQVDDLLASLGF